MYTEIAHLKNKVYYAQNREDLILEAFFPDDTKGFYVDIGAYDPNVDSVTKKFYLKGWRGINVEPQPARYKKFVRARRRDINVQCGVSSDEGQKVLRIYPNGGLSTFSKAMQKEHDEENLSFQEMSIKMVALKTLFKRHKVNKIQFMKIDVEGLEDEVLKSNDWKRYRPEVLCIEANHIVQDWQTYLIDQGYKLVFNDGLNDYYADTKTKHAEEFDYVQYVITTRGGGISAPDYQTAKMFADKLRQELRTKKSLVEYSEHLLAEVAKRQHRLEELEILTNSPHLLFRKLIRTTLSRIRRR
jgi:FkbM family methyltransferase